MSSLALQVPAASVPRAATPAARTRRVGVAARAPPRRFASRSIAKAAAETSYENGTIDLELPTEEARRTLQFDKVIVNEEEGPVIFVTGVAIGSAAEAAGVTPGQRLVALSDPVNDGELWFIDGSERLAFVVDAIRSTRKYDMTIVFESEAGTKINYRTLCINHAP